MLKKEDGFPLSGDRLTEWVGFLRENGIRYEGDALYTVVLRDRSGRVAATGSLGSRILKYIVVDDAYRGEGILSQLMTCLMEKAVELSFRKLFLYTKPGNESIFGAYGFYKIVATDEILFMENRKGEFDSYIKAVQARSPQCRGRIGAVVCNCDPFTLGHRHLILRAAEECELVHVFVLSEDKSEFSAQLRRRMVEEGAEDLKNVVVHGAGDYLISAATMPTYFIRDSSTAEEAAFRLDLAIFCRRLAPALGITARYAGTEPLDGVTSAYNQAMRRILPGYNIAFNELPRLESRGTVVSASLVRGLLAQGKYAEAKLSLPESTVRLLREEGIIPRAE